MSVSYYPKNEILLPRWISPTPPRRLSLWLLLGLPLLLLAAIGGGLWYALLHLPEQNAKAATVLILVDRDGDGKPETQGSGVFISPRGFVLTNRHVALPGSAEPAGIEVWYRSGDRDRQIMKATVADKGSAQADETAENIRNDWAVLQVTSPEQLPFVRLSDKTDFAEEEHLKVLGFPRAQETASSSYGAAVKIVPGTISRPDRNDQRAITRLTHTAATAEGMSGGPVIQGGKLIGLNTRVLTGGKVTANENYALPTYLLKQQVARFINQ